MNILHAAGFTLRQAQRNLSDWYCVAIKYNANSYGVITPTLSLAEALAEIGRAGQVILKFPQGYNNPAVEYTWWNPARLNWASRFVITNISTGTFNFTGKPTLPSFNLRDSNLVESGFRGMPVSFENMQSGVYPRIQIAEEIGAVDYYYSDGTLFPYGWYRSAQTEGESPVVSLGDGSSILVDPSKRMAVAGVGMTWIF